MKKTIVISGGSDGLGKAIAKSLSNSHNVIILSPSEDKLKRASEEINCDYFVCDVGDYNNVHKVIENVVAKYGRIDCLVNNAGLWIQGELDDNEYERIKKVMEVNTLGVIYLSKAVIPYMKKEKDGLIININSQAGINYKKERTVYNASKWAITGFTKSLQPEVAKYGIRVTGIYPGKLKTNMFEKMGIHKDMEDGLDTKEVTRMIEFLISTSNDTIIPEICIKHIDN